MVRRGIIGGVTVTLVIVALGACSDEHYRAGRGYTSGSRAAATCSSVSTCGACTPIVGCGWCALPNGTGYCVTGPDACDAQAFSWTWEPTGCREPVDASGITINPPPPVEEDASTDEDAGTDEDASADADTD